MTTTNMNALSQPINKSRTVDRFFNRRYRMLLDHSGKFRPALNVSEDLDCHMVELSLPIMEKQNIEISICNDVLTVKGKTRHKDDHRETNDMTSIPFNFSMLLPEDIDSNHIKANMHDNSLKIIIPNIQHTDHQPVVQVSIN